MATTHYDRFIEQMRQEGISAYEASQFPEAREAALLDKQAEFNARKATKAADWYQTDEAGNKIDYFRSRDDFRAAMADPMYQASPEYRKAISRMVGNTPEEILGTPSPGANGLETATDSTLLEAALKDARIETSKRLFREASKDPIKRAELIRAMSSDDPESQAVVEQTEVDFSNEKPLQRASRLAGFVRVGNDLGHAAAQDGGSDEPTPEPGKK